MFAAAIDGTVEECRPEPGGNFIPVWASHYNAKEAMWRPAGTMPPEWLISADAVYKLRSHRTYEEFEVVTKTGEKFFTTQEAYDAVVRRRTAA